MLEQDFHSFIHFNKEEHYYIFKGTRLLLKCMHSTKYPHVLPLQAFSTAPPPHGMSSSSSRGRLSLIRHTLHFAIIDYRGLCCSCLLCQLTLTGAAVLLPPIRKNPCTLQQSRVRFFFRPMEVIFSQEK